MFSQVYHSDIRTRALSPGIGRMLDAWERSAAGHGEARLEDVDQTGCPFAARDLIVLEPLADGHFHYLQFGPELAAGFAIDMLGRSTGDLDPSIGDILDARYRQVLETRRPLYLVHRGGLAPFVHLWERLVMPARRADGSDCVVAYARPRETELDLLTAVLEASPEAIMSLHAVRDEEGRLIDAQVVYANRRAAELTGLPLEAILDRNLLELFPDLVPLGIWDHYVRVIEGRRSEQFEVNRPSNGVTRWLRFSAAPLADGCVLAYADITAHRLALAEAERARQELAQEIEMRRDLEVELRRIATIDGLTGILNRRGFQDMARRAAASALRYVQPLSLILFDIDHFKRINDRHGHAAGDIVLMRTTALVAAQLRDGIDVFARVGGEEFVILLPHTTIDAAETLAEQLRSTLDREPVQVGKASIRVTASFGVQTLLPNADADRMMIEADKALYLAKRTGRNRVVVYGREASLDAVV